MDFLNNARGHLSRKVTVFSFFGLIILLCIGIISTTGILSYQSLPSKIEEENSNEEEIPSIPDDSLYAGIVIDMGSSGSRISVFGWDRNHTTQPIPYGGPFYYDEQKTGISKFNDPKEAANSLNGLLNYAERAILSYGVSKAKKNHKTNKIHFFSKVIA